MELLGSCLSSSGVWTVVQLCSVGQSQMPLKIVIFNQVEGEKNEKKLNKEQVVAFPLPPSVAWAGPPQTG